MRPCGKTVISICVSLLALAGGDGAAPASGAPQAPEQVRTSAQQFKNIQVYKDLPAAQMNQTMHLMGGALGVECQYCHILNMWDRDDKPMKGVARRMVTMMDAINRDSFGGAPVVSCYTCHRGQPQPTAAVLLPAPKPPSVDNPPPAPPLPSVDNVLSGYVNALGGEAALRKIKTRVITGRRDIPTGPGGVVPVEADVEMYSKAPNLTLNVYKTEKFTIADGFDGTSAWAQSMAGIVASPPNPDALRAKRMAAFYEPLELKEHYRSMSVRGIETVNGRPAYVIVASPEGDTPERLYFDTQTGLLLRRSFYLQVASGPSPFEMNFDSYRDVSGVKIPFVVRMSPASQRTEIATSSTLRVTRVQTNVPLDDARFLRPQAAAQQK